MVKRIFLVFLGISLLLIVAFVGWKTAQNANFVIWFGLASALLAPAGFAMIGFGLRSSNDDLVRKLSRVPELQELIAKAESHEEKIKALEEERSILEKVVKFEARRQSLIERKENLENEAIRIIGEFDAVKSRMKHLDDELAAIPNHESIDKLRERIKAVESGDIVLSFSRKFSLAINTRQLILIPFGDILIIYIRTIQNTLIAIHTLVYFISKMMAKAVNNFFIIINNLINKDRD